MEQKKVIFWIEAFNPLIVRVCIMDTELTGIISKLFKFMAKKEIDPNNIKFRLRLEKFNSEIYGYASGFTFEDAEKIRAWLLEQGATEK